MPPSSKTQAHWMRAILARKMLGAGASRTINENAPLENFSRGAEVDERGYVSAEKISKKTTKGWLDAFDGE